MERIDTQTDAAQIAKSGTAADVFIETIMGWGIDTIFGIPGDGINGVIEALRTRQDKVKFIQTRHEESAAFMACAYAKYTGKMACHQRAYPAQASEVVQQASEDHQKQAVLPCLYFRTTTRLQVLKSAPTFAKSKDGA